MMIFTSKTLLICVVSAVVSALAGFSLWLSLSFLWPSFLALPFVVSLPSLLCWRYCGRLPALVSGLLAALLFHLMLPTAVAFLMALHLLLPSLFILLLADIKLPHIVDYNSNQGNKMTGKGHGFLPLSYLIATNALVSAGTTLILTVFFINRPDVAAFFENMAWMWQGILREAQLYSPQLEAQIALILKADMAVTFFAFYGFTVPLVNFYIVGRIERPASCRPADYWPMAASHLPRMSVALLIVSSLAALLPLGETIEDCLKIIAMILINAFMLCGLAATHVMTRGKNWRAFALTGLYVFASLPIVSIALAGLGVFASITPLLEQHKKNNPPSI